MRQTVQATKIIGTLVRNWQGEELGTITEIMIHKFEGTIAYLVLSYVGDFGLLNPTKRFAVPFEAIARKRAADGTFEYILNVDRAFLERFPGFDEENWPDFADERFITLLSEFYKDVHVDVSV